MLTILQRGLYNAWLDAPPEQSIEFMRMFPADRLLTEARPKAPVSTDASLSGTKKTGSHSKHAITPTCSSKENHT